MVTKKILFVFIIIIFFVTTGADCGSCFNSKKTIKEKITLTMWGVYDDEAVYKPLIDLYQQLNTNISIKYVKKDYVEYEKETVDALAAGKGPDIWMIRNDWVYPQYDKLMPMTSGLLKKSDSDTRSDLKIYEDTFPDIAVKDNAINNKIYGVPLSIDTLVLYFNTDNFNKKQAELYSDNKSSEANLFLTPPNNWEDFLKVAELLTIKDKNGNITRAGAALGAASNVDVASDILAVLMMQNKTEMTSADRLTATFNLPVKKETGEPTYAGTQALSFLTSFSDPIKENYMWNTSMPNSIDAFMQGKASMMINYGHVRKLLAQQAPNLNYRIGPLPQVPGDIKSTDYASYWVETVTNSSKHPEAAWRFIKFLSDNSDTYDAATNRPPAKRLNQLLLPETKQRAAIGGDPLLYQPMSAAYWYKGKYPVKVDVAFYDMIQNLVVNKEPAQKAIDTAASVVTKLYQMSIDITATSNPTPTSTVKSTVNPSSTK